MPKAARKEDAICELRTLDKVAFFSTATCEEECREEGLAVLREGSYKKVGVPCVLDGKKVVIVVSGEGSTSVIDISSLSASSVLDNVKQGDIFENIDRFMEKMVKHLVSQGVPDSLSYSIRMQETGTTFTTHITEGAVLVAAFSKLTPTYFDLCLRLDKSALVHYNARTAGNLLHSGDIVDAGELLHTVKVTSKSKDTVVVPFLTGYQSTPLHRFEEHRPVVMVWDHVTKECFVIRVPLDPITIGEHTLCAPIVGKMGSGDTIHWEVLANPCAGTGAAPTFNATSIASLNRARACGVSLDAKGPSPQEGPLSAVSRVLGIFGKTPEKKPKKLMLEEKNTRKLVLLHTEDVDPSFTGVKADVYVRFGTSLAFGDAKGCYHGDYHTTSRKLPKPATDPVLLPCVVPGGLTGGLLLTAGRVSDSLRKGVDLEAFYNTTRLLVAVVSDKMLDPAREVNPFMRLNGLYIVVPSTQPPAHILDDSKKTREYLMGININAAMSLAGPQSLVVAALRAGDTHRYFVLDGAGMPLLVGASVAPFTEVTREFNNFKGWTDLFMESKDTEAMKVLSDRRARKVTFRGDVYKVEGLADLFKRLSCAEITAFKGDVAQVLAQLRMLLDDSELKKLGNKLVAVLKEKMVPKWELAEHERASLDEMLAGNMKLSESYKAYKNKCSETKKSLQWLVEELGCMVSSSRAGTIGFNIQRLAKAQKVAANVGAALNMSLKDFTDLTEEHCSVAGAVVCTANKEALNDLLERVADNTYKTFASEQWEALMVRNPLTWDKPLFDANAVGCLLELTTGTSGHPLAQRSGVEAQTLAMPNSHAEDNVSALALFLLDRFVEMKNPYTAKWYAHADWRPVAVIRVLLRGTIADASMCREITPAITPTNYDLGLFLATVILSQIRQITERRSGSAALEFDDTITQITRGLYGFVLTLLASTGTGQPISTAWQLVSESTEVPQLPQDHDWVYYGELVRNFKGTGWDARQLRRNITWLLVHWANLKVAQPLCNALRGATKGGKDLVTGQRLEKPTFSYMLKANKVPDSGPLNTYGGKHLTYTMLGASMAGKSALVEMLTGRKLPRTSGTLDKTVDGSYYDMPVVAAKPHITLVDVPGDRMRTKNFLAHASLADHGLLVVSADCVEAELQKRGLHTFEGKGRSHCKVLTVLGKKQVVVAVSKMDKVSYGQEQFESAVQRVRACLGKTTEPVFVPIDNNGENIHTKSTKMPWYDGPPLSVIINEMPQAPLQRDTSMLMTITRRYKVPGVGYVVVGKVTQGVVSKGDTITFLGASCGPITSRAKSLETHPGKVPVDKAEAGDLVGVYFRATDKKRLPRGGCIAVAGDCTAEDTCVPVSEHSVHVQVTKDRVRVGNEMQLYTGTTRDTIRVEKIQLPTGETTSELKKGKAGKVTFTTRYRGVVLATGMACPLSRLVFMDGPDEVMVGCAKDVVAADEKARMAAAEVVSKAKDDTVAVAGRMVLPKCLAAHPVGVAVQRVLGGRVLGQKFGEEDSGVLTQEQLDRATTMLAGCRPPPVGVMEALCEEARVPLTEEVFGEMIDELVENEGSAAVEMSILKRLGH